MQLIIHALIYVKQCQEAGPQGTQGGRATTAILFALLTSINPGSTRQGLKNVL